MPFEVRVMGDRRCGRSVRFIGAGGPLANVSLLQRNLRKSPMSVQPFSKIVRGLKKL